MRAALLPVVVWAAHFMVLYGFTAYACARQLAAAVPWVAGAASAAALLALLAIAVPAGIRAARASRFADVLASGLGGLAMIGVLWEASSLFWVAACA